MPVGGGGSTQVTVITTGSMRPIDPDLEAGTMQTRERVLTSGQTAVNPGSHGMSLQVSLPGSADFASGASAPPGLPPLSMADIAAASVAKKKSEAVARTASVAGSDTAKKTPDGDAANLKELRAKALLSKRVKARQQALLRLEDADMSDSLSKLVTAADANNDEDSDSSGSSLWSDDTLEAGQESAGLSANTISVSNFFREVRPVLLRTDAQPPHPPICANR